MLSASILNLPGQRRMLDVVRDGLTWATTANFAVSFTRCSGLGLLVEPLREAVERSGEVNILTSTYQCITQPEALSSLARMKGVKTWLQDGPTGFHAKFWMFDDAKRAEAWAGSSNLSKGGLASNIEWNLRSTEAGTVTQARQQFFALLQRSDVRPLSDAVILEYAARYEARAAVELPRVAESASPGLRVPNAAQTEALTQLTQLRARGVKRAAVIAATGVGKTFLAAFDAQQMKAKSVLFVSHRLEHLTQAKRTFEQVLDGAVLECHTVQTLARRPELLDRKWDYLVIDEFHHAEAPSYQPLRRIRDNGHTFLLGLTATPERQDGQDVLEWCDWNIAYEVRLPEAIERGWLLPFHYFAIADHTVDFLKINWKGGMTPALEQELSIPQRVELIREKALQYGFDGPRRATVCFCAGLVHAEYMARAFNALVPRSAAFISGEDKVEVREAVYARLADPTDPLEWLFVADVLNEGVDIPAINSILFLRPTESPTVFLQQLGRGLRLTPGCEVLTVLDFVGHQSRAWLALQAIHSATNTGAVIRVGDEVVRPPGNCEVVLERKTLEILAKIRRHTNRRDWCDAHYREVRSALGRPPLPIDFWQREGAPTIADFRTVYGDWLACQEAHQDLPSWAEGLSESSPARAFLAGVERDWQAQRIHPYAIVWGLASGKTHLLEAYDAFFQQFPHWAIERSDDPLESALGTFKKKLPGLINANGLAQALRRAIGNENLLAEVQGRILPTINRAFEERHGGVLRTPAELRLHKRYRRPEIVRHFGSHYDPARHNKGVVKFGQDLVLLFKLDTRSAKAAHQYSNELVSERRVKWSSQTKMRHDNQDGLDVVDHRNRGITLRLFVQEESHVEAIYLGPARYVSSKGDAPMSVVLELEAMLPEELLQRLPRR